MLKQDKTTQVIMFSLIFWLTVSAISFAEDWALLVGVNEYQAKYIKDLRFCESDVALFKELVIKYIGFKEENIKVLLSKEATKANIKAGFDWLKENAEPQDKVIFYFSGHGAQVPDYNGDEEDDSLDEIFCVHELNQYKRETYLLDDELVEWLDAIKAESKVVILDCCHSGTGTRDLLTAGNNTKSHKFKWIDKDLAIVPRRRKQKPKNENTNSVLPTSSVQDESIVLLSASAAHQTAAESPKLGHGVLTYYLVKNMHKIADSNGDNAITVEELGTITTTEIRSNGWRQNPQIEGKKETVFLKVSENVVPHGRILSATGDRIKISLGKEDGLTNGSICVVYNSVGQIARGKKLGEIEIVAVEKSNSFAKFDKAPFPVQRGYVIVETEHRAVDRALMLYFEGIESKEELAQVAESVKNLIRQKLINLPENIKVVDKPEMADKLIRGEVKQVGDKIKIDVHLADTKSGDVDTYGGVVMADTSSATDVSLILQSHLEKMSRKIQLEYAIKALASLSNRSSDFKVTVTPNRGPNSVYKVGDPIAFHVEASKDCYVILLYISADGSTMVLYPYEPGDDTFVKEGERFSVPPEGDEIELEEPTGQEVIKVIATQSKLNLDTLDMDVLMKKLDKMLSQSSGATRGLKYKRNKGWAVSAATYQIVE